VRPPWAAASPRRGKVNILNKKKILGSTDSELCSPMKKNRVNNTIVLKLIVCVTGGHCVYSPLAPTNPAAPLGKQENVTVITVCVSVI